MTGVKDIVQLLQDNKVLSGQEIYQKVGRSMPLIQWVRQGHFCCAKSDKGLVYFLPENRENLGLKELRGESIVIHEPVSKHESTNPITDLELDEDDLKLLQELEKQGIELDDTFDIKATWRENYKNNVYGRRDSMLKRYYTKLKPDPAYMERNREYQRKRYAELKKWDQEFMQDIINNTRAVLDSID